MEIYLWQSVGMIETLYNLKKSTILAYWQLEHAVANPVLFASLDAK